MPLRSLLACLAVLLAGSVTAQQEPPAPDLPAIFGYWELSSNTLNSVASTNHGVVVGDVCFQDRALVLDGGSYVNLGSGLPINDDFSMALWACPATNDRLMRVLGRFEGSEGNKDYCLFLNCGNRLWAFCSDDGSASEGHAILQTSLLPACPAGEWHHFAMTWDASQGPAGLSLYSDGEALATTNAQISEIHSLHVGEADLTVGAYNVPALRASAKLGEDGSSVEGPALTNSFQGSLCQLLLFRGVVPPEVIADIAALGRFEDLRDCFPSAAESSLISSFVLTGPSNNISVASSQAITTALSNQASVVPLPPSVVRSGVIYVDKARGNDTYSGKVSLVLGSDGPKKTIRSGLSAAGSSDTVIIKEGRYGEDLNVAGRNLMVRFEGNVNLSGRKLADTITPPLVTNVVTGASTNHFK